MVEATVTDDRVLEMRSTGRSYGAIARAVGLARAPDAQEAFLRAVRRRPAGERAALREAELRRVDQLAEWFRLQPGITEQELERKLRAVEQLRATVLAD